MKTIDLRDTFLDWKHLNESLPDSAVQSATGAELEPPYVITSEEQQAAKDETSHKSSRKRKRTGDEQTRPLKVAKVSTYQPPRMGPYPANAPKTNTIRFTPTQVEAIHSGTQPGLTVIVGPPGTGKTDVATQIINNIYHDFPDERTLLVAHSNQALKPTLPEDRLRLISTNDICFDLVMVKVSFNWRSMPATASMAESSHFLEIGSRYLEEVARLSASIEAPGAHGTSCETADYFNSVYVKPAWKRYQDVLMSAKDYSLSRSSNIFHSMLTSPTHRSLCSPSTQIRKAALEVAKGC